MSSSYLPLSQTFKYLSSPIAPGDKILQRLWTILKFLNFLFTRNLKLTLKTESSKVGSLRQNVLKNFSLYRQFCFEHKFYLCHHCRHEEETFNNFGANYIFPCELETLFSFPICCKVTIMVIRDIKSKNKIGTNCNNPFWEEVKKNLQFGSQKDKRVLYRPVLHKGRCRGSLGTTVYNKTRGNRW